MKLRATGRTEEEVRVLGEPSVRSSVGGPGDSSALDTDELIDREAQGLVSNEQLDEHDVSDQLDRLAARIHGFHEQLAALDDAEQDINSLSPSLASGLTSRPLGFAPVESAAEPAGDESEADSQPSANGLSSEHAGD
jgi:hypothetical protein